MAPGPTTYYLTVEFIKIADNMEPRFMCVTTDVDIALGKKAIGYQAVVLEAVEYAPEGPPVG
jgi:thymidine phosphorylase